jgi:hypothetical protein
MLTTLYLLGLISNLALFSLRSTILYGPNLFDLKNICVGLNFCQSWLCILCLDVQHVGERLGVRFAAFAISPQEKIHHNALAECLGLARMEVKV